MTEQQFTEVYEKSAPKVLAGVMRVVQNQSTAEDLVQETFLKFLQESARNEVRHADALLFRISHNLALDHLRSQARRREAVDAGVLEMQASTDREGELRLLRRSILERLRSEDERLLRLYVLTVDFHLPIEAAGNELGVSRRTAFRLRDLLKNILAEFL